VELGGSIHKLGVERRTVPLPDLREWIETIVEVPDTWTLDGDSVQIRIGETERPIVLNRLALEQLRENKYFPSHPDLVLVPHCGITMGEYAEFLVDIEGFAGWPASEPLRFRLGATNVRVGDISPALALLLEPIYQSDDHLQMEFAEGYTTIQLDNSASPQVDAQLALFYLNADYLKPFRAAARIWHLADPKDPEAYPPAVDPDRMSRRRSRSRERLPLAEPIALFNAAAANFGEAKFLGFYRVLEFFFARGSLAEFGRRRRDLGVSDAQLLRDAKLDKELPQLKMLLASVLTAADQRSLCRYARHHGFTTDDSLESLAEALYRQRNSIVHAKEAEMRRTAVPNPFQSDSVHGAWEWVVEVAAAHAIRRLSGESDA